MRQDIILNSKPVFLTISMKIHNIQYNQKKNIQGLFPRSTYKIKIKISLTKGECILVKGKRDFEALYFETLHVCT